MNPYHKHTVTFIVAASVVLFLLGVGAGFLLGRVAYRWP